MISIFYLSLHVYFHKQYVEFRFYIELIPNFMPANGHVQRLDNPCGTSFWLFIFNLVLLGTAALREKSSETAIRQQQQMDMAEPVYPIRNSGACQVTNKTIKAVLSCCFENTVDSHYLDIGYLKQPLISMRKSGQCLNLISGNKILWI